ncbi:MAG: tRNA (guanosine(46)-N7)-methyltransferase TrmB [Lachnospiraceae bacterium]|nr:tRNA (guanosine(46)-N7)-methyltransferase TrmB [Lachnospiraceae bacterium]
MRLRNIPEAKTVVANSRFVVQEPESRKGSWKTDGRELMIEIGMGKGKFIIEQAQQHPETDFLGIERYESVLFRACNQMEGIPVRRPGEPEQPEAFIAPQNLKFLSMDARLLPDVFADGEVDRIFLNFSDPWPKARHAKRRLTYRDFLKLYEQVLKIGGMVEFKTDNRPLFDFSVEEFREYPGFELQSVSYDLHRDPELMKDNIMTEYEKKFSALGNKICRLTAVRL